MSMARGPASPPGDQTVRQRHPVHAASFTLLDQVCWGIVSPGGLPNPSTPALRRQTASGLLYCPGPMRACNAIETAMIKYRVPHVRAGRSFWDDADTLQFHSRCSGPEPKEGMGLEIDCAGPGWRTAAVGISAEAAGGSLWRVIDPEDPKGHGSHQAALN